MKLRTSRGILQTGGLGAGFARNPNLSVSLAG